MAPRVERASRTMLCVTNLYGDFESKVEAARGSAAEKYLIDEPVLRGC